MRKVDWERRLLIARGVPESEIESIDVLVLRDCDRRSGKGVIAHMWPYPIPPGSACGGARAWRPLRLAGSPRGKAARVAGPTWPNETPRGKAARVAGPTCPNETPRGKGRMRRIAVVVGVSVSGIERRAKTELMNDWNL